MMKKKISQQNTAAVLSFQSPSSEVMQTLPSDFALRKVKSFNSINPLSAHISESV